MTSPPSGQTFGRYRLLEQIGRGGMAEVFKAKSFGVEGFEKLLVIKRIVPRLAAHQEFVEMFVQEAKLAVSLSHANIVQVFDLGRIEDPAGGPPNYFIAMEYVAGVDLASVLAHWQAAKDPLPIGLALYVAQEVSKALDHAHRRLGEDGKDAAVVHRDISPQNILLSWDGDVKVTDFGIAKAVDTITRDEEDAELEASRATGKISFMSPEQARSERTDARSDLFSLGAVLYEMIGGSNPFRAPTLSETIRRISAGEYPPLHLVRADTPEALEAIVNRLLRASPGDRFASAAELHEQLVGFSYTSGDRYGAHDLASLLAPLRQATVEQVELEATSVLDEPEKATEMTPVEIPHASTPPPPVSQPESGERREVSALVLSFGGELASEAPRKLLRRVRDLLDRHGAWLEKHSAHQVVAIFGLGDTDGRDAEAAVRAALALVRERRHGVLPSAGVHSGPISVDDGGIPVHDERMASLLATAQSLARATEGQVALSPVAGRLVRRSFVTEPLATSGRAVADGGLVVRRALSSEVPRSRFVGRTAELKRLGQILASATRDKPQIVVVRGETGMGKSRLLAEARRRLELGHYAVAYYSASCPLNGASMPWSGLRAMLHVLCGTQPDDDPRRILEVAPRLRALGLRDDQSSAVLNLLGARIKGPDSDQRALLRASFERMVHSLSRDNLHCFAWDDAQAIDRETLEAVLRVLRRQRKQPPESAQGATLRPGPPLRAVFILTQRGEVPPALAKWEDVHVVELDELAEEETIKLIETQLGARSIPPSLLTYVRSCAGGHPLFVEELLRELGDSGVVQVLNGSVQLADDAKMRAPRTLRTLVADRVSRLQQRERKVLQGIAILGEPCSTPVLGSVVEQSLQNLDRHLTVLENKALVRRTGPTQVRFASPLYQEIVLDAMAAASRQELHARAAQSYIQAEEIDSTDAAERIAEHLIGCGDRAGAVTYFWRGAEDKLPVDQLEAALRSMLRGLELTEPSQYEAEQLLDWLDKVAHTVSQVRKAAGLREGLSPLLREIDARGDPRQRALAHIRVATALGSINLFEEAYEALEPAAADLVGDPELARESLKAEIQLAARQGLFSRAVKAGERLEEMGDIQDADALLMLALARAMSGEGDAALELLSRVDALGEPTDALEAVVRLKHRTLIHFQQRRYEEAARAATELTSLARAAGLRFDAAAALHNLGDIYDRLGDHPRAYSAFVDSLELTRQLEHERLTNLNQMHLCLLDGLRSPEGAEERLKSHLRYADGHGYVWDVLEGRFMLARLAAARGAHQRARKLLVQVTEMAEEHGQHLIRSDASELLRKLEGDD